MEGPVFEAVHDDADGDMLLQNRIFLSDCINQAAGRINRGGDLFSPRPLTLPAVIKQSNSQGEYIFLLKDASIQPCEAWAAWKADG